MSVSSLSISANSCGSAKSAVRRISSRMAAAAVCFSTLMVLASAADARLIRRAGMGSPVAPAITGQVTHLIDANLLSGFTYDPSVGNYVDGSGVELDLSLSDLSSPGYSFTSNDGEPVQVNLNWGSACGEAQPIPGQPAGVNYNCEFDLNGDDPLRFGGHVVGLPGADDFAAGDVSPIFEYEWTLQAGINTLVFDELSPETSLGDFRTFDEREIDPDGFEMFCFVRFKSYSEGGCQVIEFDSGGLLGSDIGALADGGDISLFLSARYIAPTGFVFANLVDRSAAGDFSDLAINTAVTSEIGGRSLELPINIVPAPGTLGLLAAGFFMVGRRRFQMLLRRES
ncbi:MAG: hypothetical protein AAGI88_14265 [Pseudomonadota bacterium]